MSSEPLVSVIISCFNEEQNIVRCIEDVARSLPAAEIVVVHGGFDRTLQVARELQPRLPGLVLVRNENDRGKGHGIRTGIEHCRGDIIAQYDADHQFEAADLAPMVHEIRSGACDICVGSRFLPASDRAGYTPSFFRDAGNRLLGWYISLLSSCPIADVTTGMKAFTRHAIKTINFSDDRFTYEAEILVRGSMRGFRIKEIPVRYNDRAGGASMHKNNWAVILAGGTIVVKCLGYWLHECRRRRACAT